MAYQDLLELERCGVQVKWPQAETMRVKGHEDGREFAAGLLIWRHPDESSERQQADKWPESQSEDLASVLEDLNELYRSGLAVRWPS